MVAALNQQKAALRQRLAAARAGLESRERRRLSQRITENCLARLDASDSRTVFVYVSTDEEVDTHPLIERLVAQGRTVLVPRIRRGQMQTVEFPGWAAMRPAALGILAPPDQLPEFTGNVEAVIVPGLGFTLGGLRLGYGGGYYDRWLAQHPAALAIAVAFEVQLVAALPHGPHDVTIRHLETEMRSIRLLRTDQHSI